VNGWSKHQRKVSESRGQVRARHLCRCWMGPGAARRNVGA